MASKIMRAIRVAQFGGPEVLKLLSDVPIPTPADNQVLVKVGAAGVNPVETYIRAGQYARLPALPFTPGNELSGIVHDVGPNVKKYKKGDRVYAARSDTGAYAEYALVAEPYTFLLHPKLSFSQGAMLGVAYCTAYRALHTRGQAKPGETLLVHGASGSVGSAACQMAVAHGLRVFGTAGTDSGTEVVKQCGTQHVFNHREKGYTDNIMKATDGVGVDIILEMLANVNLATDLELLAPEGRVLVVGNRGSIEINPRLTMGKETDIRGVMLGRATEADFAEIAEHLYPGSEAGWLRPVIGLEFPLAEASKAHEEVISHSAGTRGKIVLKVSDL